MRVQAYFSQIDMLKVLVQNVPLKINMEIIAKSVVRKYEAAELINPVSTISGQKPVVKTSEHVFFKLSKLETNVANWMKATPLQEAVKNKLEEWFQQGLKIGILVEIRLILDLKFLICQGSTLCLA